MSTNEKTIKIEDRQGRLSTLWIFIVSNIAFADIIGFLNPGALEDIISGSVGFEVTQGLVLAFAVLMEISIAMIFLSRVLPYRANRWANIIASVITILFVVGLGDTHLSYLFFETIEVVSMSFIVWYAWTWTKQEA